MDSQQNCTRPSKIYSNCLLSYQNKSIEEERAIPNLFSEASITLTPKTGNDTTSTTKETTGQFSDEHIFKNHLL